jgi:hypothetical protein
MASSEIRLSIIGPREILEQLRATTIKDVMISKPVPLTGPSDILDAPMNPKDVADAFDMIKVIFDTGIAGLTFVSALLGILKQSKGKVSFADPDTGRSLGTLDHTSPEDEARRLLKV